MRSSTVNTIFINLLKDSSHSFISSSLGTHAESVLVQSDSSLTNSNNRSTHPPSIATSPLQGESKKMSGNGSARKDDEEQAARSTASSPTAANDYIPGHFEGK